MSKVVVIGRRADILPFKAAGAELREVRDGVEAWEELMRLAMSEEPLLVMITEDLAEECGEGIEEFRKSSTNVFLPIPTINSSPGKRLEEIRLLIARALGVDLLGRKDVAEEELLDLSHSLSDENKG
jgi:vacuolar-type H+-ATPase subunit F/Vma7